RQPLVNPKGAAVIAAFRRFDGSVPSGVARIIEWHLRWARRIGDRTGRGARRTRAESALVRQHVTPVRLVDMTVKTYPGRADALDVGADGENIARHRKQHVNVGLRVLVFQLQPRHAIHAALHGGGARNRSQLVKAEDDL